MMSETPLSGEGLAPLGDRQVPAPTSLSRPEKAAVILSLLEPENARQLAARFDPGRIETAVRAFEALPMLDKDELSQTVTDYLEALEGDIPLIAGGPRRASELAAALSADAPGLPDGGEPEGSLEEGADAEAVWAYVRRLKPEEIAGLISSERPAIISAVLFRLGREAAEAVIEAVEAQKAADVITQMLSGRTPAPRTYDAIAESLRRAAPGRLADPSSEPASATELLADILNAMPSARQEEIMTPVRERAPAGLPPLEAQLLRFDTLQDRLPKTFVPTVFREVDQAVLDVALKHALARQAETAEFMLASISQRLAEQIRERIEERPPVSASEGEKAQAQLMQQLIGWAREDRFVFKNRDEGAEDES